METFFYTFSINVDNPLLMTNKAIDSPVFQTKFNGVSFSWKMKFKSKTEKNNNRPCLYLYAESVDKLCVDAKVQSLLIPNDKDDILLHGVSEMIHFSIENGVKNWGWCEFSPFSFNEEIPKAVKIYSDNCFKILCKIYIPDNCFNKYLPNFVDNKAAEIAVCLSNVDQLLLPKNLAEKYFDQVIGKQPHDNLSDAVLISNDDQSFYCHKVILASSSEIFNDMFSRFEEAKPDGSHLKQYFFEIDDIDGDTLKEVLRYIYKKEFGTNVDSVLENCLYAAEKHNLRELKAKCIATLKFNLNVDNVFNMLDLAYKTSSDSLKMGCFDIMRLFDHMIHHSEFKTFLEKHNFVYPDMITYFHKRFDTNLVL